jgi:hypothetical protein
MSLRLTYTHPDDCACYKCAETEYHCHDDGTRSVRNNMEHHTFGQPCGECGRERSEYRDLGRKGRYVCWWCRERAAGAFGPTPAPPTR